MEEICLARLLNTMPCWCQTILPFSTESISEASKDKCWSTQRNSECLNGLSSYPRPFIISIVLVPTKSPINSFWIPFVLYGPYYNSFHWMFFKWSEEDYWERVVRQWDTLYHIQEGSYHRMIFLYIPSCQLTLVIVPLLMLNSKQ